MDRFRNRHEAGIALAKKLIIYAKKPDILVLALPRGGVPVAYEIAKALTAPLDILIVRKLGVPGHQELAIGAIAADEICIFNETLKNSLHLSDSLINTVIKKEKKELQRRESLYRHEMPPLSFINKTIILVDDGIATGATMLAALEIIAKGKAKQTIIATPVAAAATCKQFSKKVYDFVCLLKPIDFYAVGLWYDNFNQTTDEEVAELLKKANQNGSINQ
ncbi:MAG: phosphoribosyltransferase [Tatlockia sp.]|nr:phosphoribosyltransferase [Tatlockia sp.]